MIDSYKTKLPYNGHQAKEATCHEGCMLKNKQKNPRKIECVRVPL